MKWIVESFTSLKNTFFMSCRLALMYSDQRRVWPFLFWNGLHRYLAKTSTKLDNTILTPVFEQLGAISTAEIGNHTNQPFMCECHHAYAMNVAMAIMIMITMIAIVRVCRASPPYAGNIAQIQVCILLFCLQTYLEKARIMLFQLTANKVKELALALSGSTDKTVTVSETARGRATKINNSTSQQNLLRTFPSRGGEEGNQPQESNEIYFGGQGCMARFLALLSLFQTSIWRFLCDGKHT